MQGSKFLNALAPLAWPLAFIIFSKIVKKPKLETANLWKYLCLCKKMFLSVTIRQTAM